METVKIDGFTFELIESDLMYVTWTGEATERAMRGMMDYALQANAELGAGRRCAIVDASQATGIDRAARKQLHELGRAKPWDRVAFVGVRFELKVLLELVIKALNLINIETAEIAFVDSYEDGLAWLGHGPERQTAAG